MNYARIYKPARSAMQSGSANTRRWVLEYISKGDRQIDNLMGWTGNKTTRGQVRLNFNTLEEAESYAKRADINAIVTKPNENLVKPKSYAENFMKK